MTICMIISTNTFVFAYSDSSQQKEVSDKKDIMYLTVANPNIEKGEAIKIIVGLAEGVRLTNSKLTVENNDLKETFEIDGFVTDEGNLLFESDTLEIGCYCINKIEADEFSMDFKNIGIDAQFGVGTVVLDLNADAYAENLNNEEISDSIVVNPEEKDIENAIKSNDDIHNNDTIQPADFFQTSSIINIVIDPGHGGKDSGAQASYNGKTYIEKELNLKIAQYCKEELSQYKNVNVYMTRNDDSYVALEDRVKYASTVGATVLVSIHNNSISSSKVHGATVYYPNSSLNSSIGIEGGALAQEVLSQLVALGLADNGTRIRNSESGDTYSDGSICDFYSVIRNSKKSGFPGIIIEHAYISNMSDATTYLGTDSALKKLGIADANGIAKYYKLSKAKPGTEYEGINYQMIFDPVYYLNSNPTVNEYTKGDHQLALKHFVEYGMSEGRKGNEIFDVEFYKNNNIDLQNAYGNDLKKYYYHYLNYGLSEGRQASSTFDVKSYRHRYEKIQKAYGNDYKLCTSHYISFGKAEGLDATPLIYKVDFVSDGNVIKSDNVLCTRDAVAPTITKNGYVLSWDKSFKEVVSDLEITAKWTPATVLVRYDTTGGKLTNTSKNVTYLEPYGELETPVRDGYTFTGWYTAVNGGKHVTKETKVEATSEHTLYAHWTANSYVVTLNPNGGEVNGEPRNIFFGSEYGELPVPTRSGYTFTGWWTDIDSGERINESSKVNIASNHQLYAHWTLNNTMVSYQTHVKNIGWQQSVQNGTIAGTVGKALQLEAIKIDVKSEDDLGVIYTTHVSNDGWHGNSFNGEMSGTTGQNKPIEAIMIKLTGKAADRYDIYYRVHAQNIGWMAWAKNGQAAGTSGYAYRLEAIQIIVTDKNDAAPTSSYGGYTSNSTNAYISKSNIIPIIKTEALVKYQSHVRNIGWQSEVNCGQISGTTGKDLRLEGIKIGLDSQPCSGEIKYQTHIQNVGWQNEVSGGVLAGTTGKALNLEAIKIALTGEIADKYDIYYRVHVQNYGWMAWAKNGQSAGTSGMALGLEAIQIVLVDKGANAPASSYQGVVSNNVKAFISK